MNVHILERRKGICAQTNSQNLGKPIWRNGVIFTSVLNGD